MKRSFDILFSLFFILLLFPFLLLFSILILLDSRGPVLFMQVRAGRHNKDFFILKFRTMHLHAEKKGQLTVGGRDPRITRFGYFLRRYKLDELPQLFNVLAGDMSIVGPRPEVRKYIELYTDEQKKVLSVKPGLTEYASIAYSDENELLSHSPDPEKTYINEIMPAKLSLNLKYISEQSFITDMKIIWLTVKKIFR